MANGELGPLKFTVLGDVSAALSELAKFNAEVAKSTAGLSARLTSLEKTTAQTSAQIAQAMSNQIPAAVSQSTRAINNFGLSAGTALQQVGARMTSLRSISLTLGTVLGGAFAGKTLQGFEDFDKAITAVRAVSKDTEAAFASTRAEALRLATDLGVSAKEIAVGLNDIVQAGFSSREAFDILTASVRGSKAGLTDTATASKALISVLNAFRLPASQSSEVMGKLVKAVDLGIFTFPRLAENIGQVSSQAAIAGASLEELLAIMTSLTRTELNLDEVTTQLKALFNQLVNPSEAVRGKMEAILGTTGEASIKTRGLAETLRLLIEATGGSAAGLSELFPGIRELAAIAKVAQAGVGGLNNDFKILATTGATTLTQTIDIQRGSVSDLITTIKELIGLGFTKFFEDNRTAIVNATTAMRDFARENQDFLKTAAKVTLAVGALAIALGTLGIGSFAIGLVISGLGKIVTLGASAAGAIRLLVQALAAVAVVGGASSTVGIAAAAKGLVVIIAAAGAAIGPILAVAAAIAAVAAAGILAGKYIGEWLFGVTEASKAVVAQYDENEKAAAAQAERDRARRDEAIDGEKSKAQAISEAYARLRTAAGTAGTGNLAAVKEVRAISEELKKLGEVRPLNQLKADYDELLGKLNAYRAAQVKAGEAPDAAGRAFEKIFGDPKKGDEALARFLELSKAIRGYGFATSATANHLLAAEAAQEKMTQAVESAKAVILRASEEISTIAENRRKSLMTPFEKAAEELDEEIKTLEAKRQDVLAALTSLVRAGAEKSPESEKLRGLVEDIDAAISQSSRARDSLFIAENKKRADAARATLDKIEDAEIEAAERAGRRTEAETAKERERHERKLREISEDAALDEVLKARATAAEDARHNAEIENIRKSDAERKKSDEDKAKREEDAAKREAQADREKRAELLRRAILEQASLGNKEKELALQTELLALEKEIANAKDESVKDELDLLNKTRERVALLKEERESAARTGQSGADVARRAQEDILGASDPIALRGSLRNRLKDVGSTGTLDAVKSSGTETLKAEAEELFKEREAALRRGDAEEVKRIDQQINLIREKYRILVEEVRRREAELLALEKERLAAQRAAYEAEIERMRNAQGLDPYSDRKAAEDRFKRGGQIGKGETLIGRDPVTGKPVAVPANAVQPPGATPATGTPGALPTAPGGTPAVPGTPGAPSAPGTPQPGGNPLTGLPAAAKGAAGAAKDALDAIRVAAVATRDSLLVVRDKLVEIVTVQTDHAAFISGLRTEIQRLKVEGSR